jgi:hypothetical protein
VAIRVPCNFMVDAPIFERVNGPAARGESGERRSGYQVGHS